jgi:hypothetical protein
MSLTSFEPLDEKRLLEVCSQQVQESATLDFKRELPGLGDDGKREFLKDVCALANGDGGDLVYGIAEDAGKANSVLPITENADATKRRLGQILDSGIEPRVSGIVLNDVPVSGGYVLVVRVPSSFNGPHRYFQNQASRFVMRSGTHTADLTYSQLRAAFDRTATLGEAARRFRSTRLEIIRDRLTWRPMMPGPICVVHLVPLAAMAGTRSVDIAALYNNYSEFVFGFWNSASRSTNLDGLVVHPGAAREQKHIPAYTMIFRSGAFEAARYGGGFADLSRKAISAIGVSKFVRDTISMFLNAARRFGYVGPAIAGAALLTVSDFIFSLPSEHFDQPGSADRPDIILPETWVDAIEAATNVDEIARPLLNVLWQAFDVEQCWLFDKNGVWQPKWDR